jgi:hypothetical protein
MNKKSEFEDKSYTSGQFSSVTVASLIEPGSQTAVLQLGYALHDKKYLLNLEK